VLSHVIICTVATFFKVRTTIFNCILAFIPADIPRLYLSGFYRATSATPDSAMPQMRLGLTLGSRQRHNHPVSRNDSLNAGFDVASFIKCPKPAFAPALDSLSRCYLAAFLPFPFRIFNKRSPLIIVSIIRSRVIPRKRELVGG